MGPGGPPRRHPLPRVGDRPDLIATIERSGLLGRGGAGFPVGRKWAALAGRAAGPAVVVVNGAEGEPASGKDRLLMARRPHLVLDGAILAAQAIRADEIVLYVGEEHVEAGAATDDDPAARVPAWCRRPSHARPEREEPRSCRTHRPVRRALVPVRGPRPDARDRARHPDGAAQMMASALDVFGPEFARHAATGRCAVTGRRIDAA